MNRIYTIMSMMAIVVTALGHSKLDAPSQLIATQYQLYKYHPDKCVAFPVSNIDLSNVSRGNIQASAFITLASGVLLSRIESMGLDVSCQEDGMAIVNGDLEDIIKLSETNLVVDVSLSRDLQPMLNTARVVSGVNDIHGGSAPLPQAYRGAGVICGIYDRGIDANHINFMNTDMSATRVKRLWSATGATGGFIEYATPERIASFTTDNRNATHGTHTMGCMVGAFNMASNTSKGISTRYAYVSDNNTGETSVSRTLKVPFYGMAPESDIVIACGSFANTNIVKGVGKIVDYAQSVGQPAVVNLSIGSITGPHDGTDYVSRYLTKYGENVIICIAAGNDGNKNMSITHDCTAADNEVKTFIPAGETAGIIDIWASDERPVTITTVIYDLNTNQTVYQHTISNSTEKAVTIATENYTADGYIHDKNFDKAFSQSYIQLSAGANGVNNRYNISYNFQLSPNMDSNSDNRFVAGIIVRGQDGQRVDMVTSSNNDNYNAEFTSNGVNGWTAGSPQFSINSLACAPNTVVVGAYTTKTQWGTLNGATSHYTDLNYTYNEIAPFSSYGKLVDGRELPHILAPGAAIISSYSSYYVSSAGLGDKNLSAEVEYNGKKHYWAREQGTSMSCPIVAGSIALWLQADPHLNVEDAIEYLGKSANKIDGVGDFSKSLAWGTGQLNAFEGLKLVIANSNSVNNIDVDDNEPLINVVNDTYEVYVPNADNVSVTIYNIAGQPIIRKTASSETLVISTDCLLTGVYILSVDNTNTTRRILVR